MLNLFSKKNKSLITTLFAVLFTAYSFHVKSQNSDMKIALHENMINKMLKAIGDVKGTSEYSFMFFKGTYNWALHNAQINIHPNKVEFTTDAVVSVGKLSYTNHVVGKMEVCYEPTTNLIYIEMVEAFYPLNILFFGKERHITDIDLKKYFETPFTFEGPLTTSTEMQFEMPDNTIKTLYAHPTLCYVKILEKMILVSADVEFKTTPFKK